MLRVEGVIPPRYDRSQVTPGVIHIGTGNFHRGHQAVYLDDALSIDPSWGIVGVSMRSAQTRDRMESQDFLYTVCEHDTTERVCRVIGSILDVVTLSDSQDYILKLVADEPVSLITLTITENGYCHTAEGGLNYHHADIEHDLAGPATPRSAPGLLTWMLKARQTGSGCPITIMSCDNLSANGAVTRSVVSEFAEAVDPELAGWIRANVTFPSTMVDRIVPATSDTDMASFSAATVRDNALIITEPFKQWIIEDNFAGRAPPWVSVGVSVVSTVVPYEVMKLRFLNATHSALSYLGLLAGYEFIHETMADPSLLNYVEHLLDEEITPVSDVPSVMDIAAYKHSILARFANSKIAYGVAQVATNGSLKLPERIFPTIEAHVDRGAMPYKLCTVVAAWLACVTDAEISRRFTDPVLPVVLEGSCQGRTDLLGGLAANKRVTEVIDRQLQAIRKFGWRAAMDH